MKSLIHVVIACFIASGMALAQSSSSNLSQSDKTFLDKAAQGGQAEVQLGQLAADKAADPSVKSFGERMVKDHSAANEKLQDVAKNLGVTLPTSLDAKDQQLKDRLEKLSGAQFDKVYMWNMVKDHKADLAEFQKEASSGKNDQVKDFAQNTVPTLQEHLKLAQQDKNKEQAKNQ